MQLVAHRYNNRSHPSREVIIGGVGHSTVHEYLHPTAVSSIPSAGFPSAVPEPPSTLAIYSVEIGELALILQIHQQ